MRIQNAERSRRQFLPRMSRRVYPCRSWMKRLAVLALCAVLMFAAAGCAKIVPIDQVAELTGNKSFDASESASGLWAEAEANIEGKAVDLPEFLAEANGDLKSLADQYGKYSMGTRGSISYAVKGSGTVEEVNTDKKAGYMVVKLDGYDGPEEIRIQIGDIYKGSSTRDTLDIVDFGDYTNQEEWAAISQELHALIAQNVIAPADVSTLEGQNVDFVGTFTADDDNQLLITAVKLDRV